MEHNQIFIEDQEKASNAYLMSLIAVVIGLPMPIINLIATGIFYFISRKSSPFVKWHTTQALVSQVPLFVLNNILFWWTVRILFVDTPLNAIFIAYFILVNLYNIADFYATAISAIKARKGITYRWFMYGPLTDMLLNRKSMTIEQKEQNTKKFILHSIISLFIFISSLFLMNLADWMRICGVKSDSVRTTTENILWKITSYQINETNTPEIVAPVDSIFTHLCLSNNIDTASVKLHLCKTSEVNAFAMAGRHVLINTGLINSCKTQHELAGVIAHELAHIQCGHIRQNTQIQLCIMIAEVLLTGGSDAQKGNSISRLSTLILSNYFIRENEAEADKQSVQYLINAQMNPSGMGDFLARMESSKFTEFLSTHPNSEKRALYIKELASKYNGPQNNIISAETWFNLKSSIP